MKVFVCVLFCLFAVSACQSAPSVELPQGDAAQGEALFVKSINGAPACSSCHHTTTEDFTGPALAGYSQRADSTVTGLSAFNYTYQSITQPARHVVSGYSNLMYSGYTTRLTSQQLADLIAYLLTL